MIETPQPFLSLSVYYGSLGVTFSYNKSRRLVCSGSLLLIENHLSWLVRCPFLSESNVSLYAQRESTGREVHPRSVFGWIRS